LYFTDVKIVPKLISYTHINAQCRRFSLHSHGNSKPCQVLQYSPYVFTDNTFKNCLNMFWSNQEVV